MSSVASATTQLARRIAYGGEAADLATVRELMDTAERAGTLTGEDLKAINLADDWASGRRDQIKYQIETGQGLAGDLGDTDFGTRLLHGFRYYSNVELDNVRRSWGDTPLGAVTNAVDALTGRFGVHLPKPSTVELEPGFADRVYTQVVYDTIANDGQFQKLVKEHPTATVGTGASGSLELRPAVLKEYQRLADDLFKGRVADENDPLGPFRQYLDTSYPAKP